MKWRILAASVTFLFMASLLSMNQALANKVKKLDLKSAGGIVVRVVSDQGKRWDRLEKGQKPVANLLLKYECRFKHKLAKGPAAKASISVSGPLEAFWKDDLLLKGEDAKIINIPLSPSQGPGVGPVKMCNDLLGSQVIETGKSKEHFLARGLTIKTDKLVSRATLDCLKVTKSGFDDFDFKKATVPLTIQCLAYQYPGQGKGKPAPSGQNPPSAPKPKRAKAPAIKKLKLELKPDRYSGLCPAKLQVDASVTLNQPAEIRYRYIGDKGHKSPVFTLKNKGKAGSWNLAPWNRYIEPPKKKTLGNLAGMPGKGDYLHKGWMKIKVLSPRPMTSKAALFEFRCNAEPDKRPTPGSRGKPMKLPGESGLRTRVTPGKPATTRKSVGFAAPGRQPAGGDGLKKDLLQWAKKVERSKVLARALAQSSRRRAGDSIDPARLKPLLGQFKRLHSEILRSGASMSPVQAKGYEKKLNALVSRMDRQTSKACNGKPSKGSLAACMCDCGEAYQGWGKGRGWNRFICKAGCLTAKTLGK